MQLPDIGNMRFKCNPILPTVYDDALSYYEVLCKFSAKLNEVIDRINNFYEDIEDLIDSKIQILKNYVDSQNKKQDDFINSEIIRLESEISKAITTIYKYVDNRDRNLKLYIDNEIADLKYWVEHHFLDNFWIFDPTVGYDNPIETVLNNIYDALRYCGISAAEFDQSEITCQVFDQRGLSAHVFDAQARCIFGKIYHKYIFNPINGAYDTVQRVLYSFFQYHRTMATTAVHYDGVKITVDGFENIEITAYEFDDNANDYL